MELIRREDIGEGANAITNSLVRRGRQNGFQASALDSATLYIC